MANLKVSLRRWQVRKARQGNVQMLIWLGKQLLGQRDKHDLLTLSPDDMDIVQSRIRESLAFYSSLSDNLRSEHGIGLSHQQITDVVAGGFSDELQPVVRNSLARLFPAPNEAASQPASPSNGHSEALPGSAEYTAFTAAGPVQPPNIGMLALAAASAFDADTYVDIEALPAADPQTSEE